MPTDGERGAGAWWKRSSPAKRLSVLSVPLVAAVAGVTAFHLSDARKRGEPLWPVLLGLGVTALILSAVVWFVRRPIAGLPPAEAMRGRSRQITKWAAPIAIALAVVGAIVQAVLSP
jgi:Mn2+/Fe2+ NRAMP family transporter